jgi:hypothetical protein
MADFRSAVVERWHEVYRAVPSLSEGAYRESLDQRPAGHRPTGRRSSVPDRYESGRFPGNADHRRSGAGLRGFLGQRPLDDEDFD